MFEEITISQLPQLKIINKPFTHHHSHPINKVLRQINKFCNLTFIKANNGALQNFN